MAFTRDSWQVKAVNLAAEGVFIGEFDLMLPDRVTHSTFAIGYPLKLIGQDTTVGPEEWVAIV